MKFTRSIKGVGLTAHYTAAVWAELGVPGAQKFRTGRGSIMKRVVEWGSPFVGLWGEYSVTNLFLAPRHLGLNSLVEETKAAQIIELAAGLSSRGAEWANRHPGLYIEIDQPTVIAAKQKLINPQTNHILLPADLREAELVPLLASHLDPALPTIIIAEGITGYMPEATLHGLLNNILTLAKWFQDSTVYIDLYLKLDPQKHGRVELAMRPAKFMWKIMHAPMRMFLRDEGHIKQFLESAGFEVAQLYSSGQLATISGRKPPPVTLFYLAQLKPKIS